MAHRHIGELPEFAFEKLKETTAWLRDYITAIRHGHIHAFTPLERKVREATRNEAWGPTGTMLNELAEATQDETSCQIIFAVLQLRLGYPPEKWRNVYKALTVLDFLLKRGSERCVQLTRDELQFKLEDLKGFAHTTAEGKDQGVNVRHRAHAIRTLLLDSRQLKTERQANQTRRRAYRGFAREELASSRGLDDQDLLPGSATSGGALRRTLSDGDLEGSSNSFAARTGGGSAAATAPYLRNAGETKGVTMEMNKTQLVELKRLLDLPENKYCADCVGGGAAGRASWASINNGVFICMRCAGVHRGLGTHVSKVRSCTLDTWLPEQVTFMKQTGNKVANAYWEAKLDPAAKPQFGTNEVEPFIQRKYARAYAAEMPWPPPAAVRANATIQDRSVEDLQDHVQPRLHSRRSTTSTMSDLRTLDRLIAVPLPAEGAAASPRINAGDSTDSLPDLMAFDASSGLMPAAARTGQPVPPTGQQDVLAELEKLAPTVSLMDSDPTILAPNEDLSFLSARSDSRSLLGFNAPAAFPPVAQIPARLAAQIMPANKDRACGLECPAPLLPLPLIRTGSQAPVAAPTRVVKAIPEPELHFQDESVKDWSQPTVTAAKGQQPLHLIIASLDKFALQPSHESLSEAPTPLFTPRFSALYGPGPVSAGVAQAAPTQYVPPDIARVNSALAGHARYQLQTSNAPSQWDKGRGNLDELVLQAMALS